MKIYHGKNNRSGIRDFNRRRYGNPLFKKNAYRSRSHDFGSIKRWAVVITLSVAFCVLLWYLFWSDTFQINNIKIEGASAETEVTLQEMLQQNLKKRRWLIFPQTSIFLYNTNDVALDINKVFYFDQFEIHKKIPHTVLVSVREKTIAVTLYTANEFFALDESGFVIRNLTKRERIALNDLPEGLEIAEIGELGAESVKVADIDGNTSEPSTEEKKRNSNSLPLIIDRSKVETKYKPGEEVLSANIIKTILEASERLPDITNSGISWFSFESAADTIEVALKDGWHIFLTTMIPFETQSDRLGLVLKEKISGRRSDLEYIDLRYDERIFFRFKESLD
ncbi:hypothetical protein KKF05_00255 [Patescibacteria group bacterium]|nr:hypothetical protein [Patescibacteria group bacterium]MBU1029585.1 hypothetical protein [Patescibacteria group bacterium]MBU1916057.1 hypothetical protein [Patescibacteria group bacterium]